MVSFTLKVVLQGAENDSKYRDVAPLKRKKERECEKKYYIPNKMCKLVNISKLIQGRSEGGGSWGARDPPL